MDDRKRWDRKDRTYEIYSQATSRLCGTVTAPDSHLAVSAYREQSGQPNLAVSAERI